MTKLWFMNVLDEVEEITHEYFKISEPRHEISNNLTF